MRKTWIRYALVLPIMVLASCGAHSPSILKENHKSIHVSVFKNETQQFSLEERLTRSVMSAFQRDGRLRLANGSTADLNLSGVIKTARVSPVGYTDLDRAIGYKMEIVLSVSVADTASGEFVIKERPFSATGTYLLSNELSTSSSQDVTDTLSEQILSALIEGW